jgi:hypothetical protein
LLDAASWKRSGGATLYHGARNEAGQIMTNDCATQERYPVNQKLPAASAMKATLDRQ